jgi:hypothetical protein
MRRPALLAALVLAFAAAGTGARAAAPACSKAAANAAIRASSLPADVKDLTRYRFSGVDAIICHDLTGDGVPDMAVTLASGGTAGDIAWAAFRRSGTRWVLVGSNSTGYKLLLIRRGRDLVETQPIYRKHDPNCCPTGGFAHRELGWNGRTLAVVRRWHDGNPRT